MSIGSVSPISNASNPCPSFNNAGRPKIRISIAKIAVDEHNSAISRPPEHIEWPILAYLTTLVDFVINTTPIEPKYPHTIVVTAPRAFRLPYFKDCLPASFRTVR